MITDLLLLWLAALPLMGSPGPAVLSAAAVGAAFGLRAGLGYLAGLVAGTFSVLLLVATGVTGIVLAAPSLRIAVTVAAAGYILYLAWRIATAPPLSKASGDGRAPSFVSGYVLAIANPKAFAALGAVYAGHTVVEGDALTDAAVKLPALFAMMIFCNGSWMAFGSLFSRFLHDPRTARITNVTFAVLLVGSVALAVLG